MCRLSIRGLPHRSIEPNHTLKWKSLEPFNLFPIPSHRRKNCPTKTSMLLLFSMIHMSIGLLIWRKDQFWWGNEPVYYCHLLPMFWIEAFAFRPKMPEETSIKTWGRDSFWLHHPYQSHGMQTLDRPVLILWGWIGNLKDYDFHYLPSHLVIPGTCAGSKSSRCRKSRQKHLINSTYL